MSAKLSPSPYASERLHRGIRFAAVGIGALVVLWGAADLTSRVAEGTFGQQAGWTAFGPAAAIQDPSLLDAVRGTAATSTATSTDPFVPEVLKVPSVGISASVEQTGQKEDGTMATPANFADVAWYKLGAQPGQPGNAVFAGHVNNALTKAGVFAHLDQVSLGDYVTVADAHGHTLVYKVVAIDEYPADEAPAASIFATSGPSRLILITCDGDWVSSEKTFDKRLVITAAPLYRQ